MTREFRFSLRLDDLAAATASGDPAAHGVAEGSSPDASVKVIILGAVDRGPDARRLAQAYVDSGRDATVCGIVDVGCMVIDQAACSVAVVAATMGLRQIFWAQANGVLSVASSPGELSCLGGRTPALRPEALFQYLYFHMVPGPDGIFDGVFKLDGGHVLRLDGGTPKLDRYWRPRFDDTSDMAEAEAAEELHRELRAAVERALDESGKAGAFLSGGLDSSTVAGLAARARPGIPTISMGFDAEGYDEMNYARIASRHFGTSPLEYYVTSEDVLATLPMIAAAFPEPFGNSSAAAAYHCARIAREHGIEGLLAGDGGDELFGGNERYAKQLVFERYARVPRVVRSSLIERIVGAAGRVTQAFPIGKALSYIQQASIPLPDRLQSYNFLHRHDPAEIFAPDLLARVDAAAPLRMLREEYSTPATTSVVNRMLFLDWKFTLHDNDLVKVNTMCDLAGVAVSYPMLDQKVVDFSLRIPGNWKVQNGDLRWFYKRAMQGFLPREIIVKTKHGFGLPFGVWTRTHDGLRRLSEDALHSLAGRGYFNRAFIEDALRLHREGHASYYGELVWILTVLELWLQQHQPGARL